MVDIVGGGVGGDDGTGGTNSLLGAGFAGISTDTNGGSGGGGGGAGATGGMGGGLAGGAGGNAAGANGLDGGAAFAGGGGGGGAHGVVSATLPTTAAIGGNGGAGGSGTTNGGGGGGAGGYGAVVSTTNPLGATLTVNVTGGNGGAGGSGSNNKSGGGGRGGIGLYIDSDVFQAVTIASSVTGGNGGTGTPNGAGGEGIVGDDMSIILASTGSISGGLSGDGTTRANAVLFTGGQNTFVDEGGTLTGNVVAYSTIDKLLLGGATNRVFDVSKIGSTGQYQGFGNIGKVGAGRIALSGTTTDALNWSVFEGLLSVSATLSNSTFMVMGGGALVGNGLGQIGALTVGPGGTVSAGTSLDTTTGLLKTGSLNVGLGGKVGVQIAGSATNSYDRISVTGTVTLGGSIELSLLNSFVPTINTSFTIIDNDSTDAVSGTFAGLTEGATIVSGGMSFTISYAGGTGNDVTLTALSAVPTETHNTGLTLQEGAKVALTTTALQHSDTDQTAANLTYTVTTAASNGTLFKDTKALALNDTFTQADIDSGAISYQHDGGETTSAKFGFSLSDGQGNTLTNKEFGFTVTAVNDAPTGAPTATLANGSEDVAYTVSASTLLQGFSDVDGPTLSVTNVRASSGSVVNNNNGTFTITQAANFNGSVTLTYDVTDGTATLADKTRSYSITATNDAASITGTKTGAVAENGILTASGKLTVTDADTGEAKFKTATLPAGNYGTFTFDAATGNWGYTLSNSATKVQALKGGQVVTDTLTVTSFDTSASETITVSITGQNDAPTGAPTAVLAAGTEDTAYTIKASDLLKGFSDIDGNTLSVTGLKSSNGTLVDNKNGTFTLTPAANYAGAVTLTYGVTDGTATLANQSRSFTLAAVNDAPTKVTLANVHAPFPESASTAFAIKVADIAVTDVDAGTNILSLTGIDAAMFSIVGSGLYLKAGAVLDFETNPLLNVTVNVDGQGVGKAVDASASLSLNVTNVTENLVSSFGADNLFGTPAANSFNGGAGNDTINGAAGDDTIMGGAGRDILTGGAGKDMFRYLLGDSGAGASGLVNGVFNPTSGATTRDVITDYTAGFDLINLFAIDANASLAGDQAFAFKGTGNFAATGDLIYRQFDVAGTANDKTIIYGDVTGDRLADFQIELTGLKALTAADFRL